MKVLFVFIFVLCVLFLFTHVGSLILKLLEKNPTPYSISKREGTLLYLAAAYVITFLIV